MSEQSKKVSNANQRASRTRSKLHGTKEKPRMTVIVSNMHISVQLIDDDASTTLVSATTMGSKLTGSMTEKAVKIGEEIAKKSKAKKISKVMLDRGSKQYHGRIKAFADAARENGMEF